MSAIFPKPLPPLSLKSEVDQTGFTELEKVALRNTWRLIQRHGRKHSRNALLKFYTEHHEYLNFFLTPKGVMDMHSLHNHPNQIMRIVDLLIEKGLDNFALFHVVLSDVRARHGTIFTSEKGASALREQQKTFEEYLRKEIRNAFSPTVAIAFTKLNHLISLFLTK